MKKSFLLIGAVSLAGCHSDPLPAASTSMTVNATDIDPAQAQPEYWLAQKPAVNVSNADFDRLWASAESVSEKYLFHIDRRDKRQGLMTTLPNVSPQWFEVWRPELQTFRDTLVSSLSSNRRTIYWTIDHVGESYVLTPKVIVERQVLAERRVSGLLNKAYFRRDSTNVIYGTAERDEGVILPESYWYPTGRDFELEKKLVEKVQDGLQ